MREVAAASSKIRGLKLETPRLEETGQKMLDDLRDLFQLLRFAFGIMVSAAILVAACIPVLLFAQRVADSSVLRVFGIGAWRIAGPPLLDTQEMARWELD